MLEYHVIDGASRRSCMHALFNVFSGTNCQVKLRENLRKEFLNFTLLFNIVIITHSIHDEKTVLGAAHRVHFSVPRTLKR